jgi:inorganic pyrophosphatase
MAEKIVHLLNKISRPHPLHGIPSPGSPDEVKCFIECAPSDQIKFEVDKETGYLYCDRPHKFSSLPPSAYGFIPRTHCGSRCADLCMAATGQSNIVGDGDPLDVVVLSTRALTRSDLVLNAIPIGGFRMIDSGGNTGTARAEADDKIICVIKGDPIMSTWKDISDVPEPLLKMVKHFFLTYKLDPAKPDQRIVTIPQTYGRDTAHEVIRATQEDYHTLYGDLSAQFKDAINEAVQEAARQIVAAQATKPAQ